MKKAAGRIEGEDFNFQEFESKLHSPPTNLWVRHLAVNDQMLADFTEYLNHQIARAASLALNLRGPEMHDDLLRLQGGSRVLAEIRRFVTGFLKEQSGRTGSGRGEDDAGTREDARTNSG